MDILHRLDEVGLPENEIRGFGLLDSDREQIHTRTWFPIDDISGAPGPINAGSFAGDP
jgi:hypothetical protein